MNKLKTIFLAVAALATISALAERPDCRITIQTPCRTIGSKYTQSSWTCPSCDASFFNHDGTVVDTLSRTYVRLTQLNEIGVWATTASITNGVRCEFKVETVCKQYLPGDPSGCFYTELLWREGGINQYLVNHGDPCQNPPEAPEYQVNVVGVDANGDLIEEVSLLQPLPTFQVEPGYAIELVPTEPPQSD